MVDEKSQVVLVKPDSFAREAHFYPRVLNAHIHPLVRYFFSLGNEALAARYCHLHPEVDAASVAERLRFEPRFFRWGGADLFHVTSDRGVRHIVVIETNSCPSGQKSLPPLHEGQEQSGYRRMLETAFLPLLKKRTLPCGDLAVLYDKNRMEASGYAATLADLTSEPVYLVPFFDNEPEPLARFSDDGVLEIRSPDNQWRSIRGAVRYVTQRPWNRIPPVTRTAILNPVLACLAGGRNKLLAAKAYDLFNAELEPSGLRIWAPETIWGVARSEVPLWVARMGGVAVVKVPYSNAGQGVFTITSPAELARFMDRNHGYDRFIVQALIGNAAWSSGSARGRMHHVGTVPDKRMPIFVADLRFMIVAGAEGFSPVAIYARRARRPLAESLSCEIASWDMLGTNLSVRLPNQAWTSETDRLLLMDSRDFNRLGIGLDDLIEAYFQTVLSVTAIDRMATGLMTSKGRFRAKFFRSINPDPVLMEEICA